jgi:hypothetical protein
MLRVAAEFQNVRLRDAHVLQQLPGRVRRARWFHSALPGREVRNHRVEVGVRVASPQEVQKMLA